MSAKSDSKNKRRNKANSGRIDTKRPQNVIRHEIVAIIILAAAVLVMISLLVEDAGLIGRLVNSLLLGLFGIGAFLLPIFALIFGGFLLVGKAGNLPKGKIAMGGVVFLLLLGIAHMIGSARPEDMSVWQYMGHIFLSGGPSNGGLFGAALSRLFIAAISEIGTYILFITASAILIMQITGRSLFAAIRNGVFTAKDAADSVKDKRAAARQRKIEHEEAQQIHEEYEEEYEHEYEYKYPAPVKTARGPLNVVLDEDGYVEGHDGGRIAIPKDGLKNERIEQKLEHRPKSSRNILLAPLPQEDAGKLYAEAEPALPGDYVINVRGIVEGYQPEAVMLQDEEEKPLALAAPARASPKPETEIDMTPPPQLAEYIFPPVELLRENTYQPSLSTRAQILDNSKKLEETLKSFGVEARVVEVSKGPTVTRYELSPGAGVKVSKISGLADDLALNLAAQGIRIEAPIPGKAVVGIEIPNKETQAVFLREVIDDDAFWSAPSKLSFAMGKDIAGNIVVSDISKMPHLLIAGSTGAGKSVCINTLIASIIYKAGPAEVKLLMIDPKVVELSIYNGIPHLLIPVVTDPKKASGALAWGVREMDERYEKFAHAKVRDLAGYNAYLAAEGESAMPQIVIIIDELADLMMTCGKEVEESICRLAQKARAAGIHLIIATQRPSVDVITGLIKANVPSRLAFAVSSGTDSRTILDMTGAEKLLGKGDMLFSPVGLSKPRRIQGSLITDKEVENIVNFIKQDGAAAYDEAMIEKITAASLENGEAQGEADPLIDEAIAFIVEREKASTSMLQRRFRIGYNRAARMMEELVARGLVGPEDGAKPRQVLMTAQQHREYLERRREM
ncbi:MAG: DNA translocase FtsK [Clostridiales bacterium]|nr:DNA translocase FtsK [Clostridiales bacterium]